MKRWLSILLLLALSVGLLIPCALAEEESGEVELMGVSTVPAYVSVTDGSGEQGGTVSFQVRLSGLKRSNGTFSTIMISNLSLQIGYDAGVLELTDVKMETLGCTARIKSPTYDTNPYVLIWSDTGNVQWSDGVIATLTFHIAKTAAVKDYPVTVDCYAGRSDQEFQDGKDVNYWLSSGGRVPLSLRYTPGTVTVREYLSTITAEDKGGGVFQVAMDGPDLSGKLTAALYTDKGQMKQVLLLDPKASQEVVFSQAAKGDLVKFMWLTDSYIPRCEAVEETVT